MGNPNIMEITHSIFPCNEWLCATQLNAKALVNEPCAFYFGTEPLNGRKSQAINYLLETHRPSCIDNGESSYCSDVHDDNAV